MKKSTVYVANKAGARRKVWANFVLANDAHRFAKQTKQQFPHWLVWVKEPISENVTFVSDEGGAA